MDPFTFTCPNCSGRLRVRNRMFVGRQVNCPECSRPLLIVENKGRLSVIKVASSQGDSTDIAVAVAAPQLAISGDVDSPPVAAWWQSSSALVGAAVAGCVLLIGTVFLFTSNNSTRQLATIGEPEQPTDEVAKTETVETAPVERTREVSPDVESAAEKIPTAATTESASESNISSPETPSQLASSPFESSSTASLSSDDEPILPEFAEPAAREPLPPKTETEIAVGLKQPILAFHQGQSAPLADVLHEVAAMLGVTVVWDTNELGTAAEKLKQPVSLKLDKTTIGIILDKLLEPARLTYRIEPGVIRIVPKPAR